MEIKTKEGSFFPTKSLHHPAFDAIKDVNGVQRTVDMVLNTFNYVDSYGDVLLPGCCKKTVKEKGPESKAVAKIQHAVFHDLERIPGKYINMGEGDYTYKGKNYSGLLATSKIANTELGNDTLINYQEGIYNNHSIGFRYIDYEFVDRDAKKWGNVISSLINPDEADERGYVCLVKEIELYEGSTVTFGANDLTPTLDLKSFNKNTYLLFAQKKINKIASLHSRLIDSVKNGGQSNDELSYMLELQLLQTKQIIADLAALVKAPVENKSITVETDFGKIAEYLSKTGPSLT